MPSIVDTIANTEAEADAIRSEANKKARLITANATADIESELHAARESVKKDIILRRENANHTAENLRNDILIKKRKEAEQKCHDAESRIDRAAKYIIERLSV